MDNNGRDIRGFFTAGNTIGRGNPSNKRMAALRRALWDCGTPERVAAIEKTLYEAAVGGDVAAIKVWLEHMVGKPIQALEVSGPEGQTLSVPKIVNVIMSVVGDDQETRVKLAQAFKEMGAVDVG